MKTALWMLPTIALFAALVALGVHSHAAERRGDELAARTRALALVDGMRSSLLAASDAERSAVLAVADADSPIYADQTRASIDAVLQQHDALAPLFADAGHPRAAAALERFAQAFADFRALDARILALAVANTNSKAYALTYGPAAQEIDELDAALARLGQQRGAPREVALAAPRVMASVWRIQALLAPHIAEQLDAKMDALEAKMAAEDALVQEQLAMLGKLAPLKDDPELAAARESYLRYSRLRAQILKLSRENTNVHSQELTLDQNRTRVMSACQDALTELRRAIEDEAPAPRAPVRAR